MLTSDIRGEVHALPALLRSHRGKGAYTRKRGLDHQTKKALIEQHLREQEGAGAPLAQLKQVLPAESERSIQRLLSEMRDEGKITLHGQRRWARWILTPRKTKTTNGV